MFETIEGILSVAIGGCALLSAITGFIVSLVKNCKNKKLVRVAETVDEIVGLATEKVVEIEQTYSKAAAVLKASGVSTGELKKENVMSYVESQCLEKGVAFDAQYWSERIERIVSVMNATKK